VKKQPTIDDNEKLKRIVEFFAWNSIARNVFKSSAYKNAHPNDVPKV
jgi:hypothetical protein